MENYLGHQYFKQGKPININAITDNELILLYISADWSAPCCKFLPILKDFYNKVNRTSAHLEIIFISCDRDEEEFNSQVSSVPWCYIPYQEQALREIIIRHYEAVSIPTVILLNSWGNIVSNTLVHEISEVSSKKCIKAWKEKLAEQRKAAQP